MYAIGIDIGYGYTKGLTSAGRQEFFASAVGPAEEIDYQLFESTADKLAVGKGVRPSGGMISLNGSDYFYGTPALRQSRYLLQARDRDWIESEPYQALLNAVIGRLAPQNYNGMVLLVTGLPVNYYRDRERLAGMIAGMMQAKGLRSSAKVIPQPFGTFFDYILDSEGEVANVEDALNRIGIIDIGYYTTDLAEINRLEYIARGSNTLEIGVSSVSDQVVQKAYGQYRRKLDPEEAEEALKTRTIRIRGRAEDISSMIDKALEGVAGALQAEMHRLWGEGFSLEKILLTGGGAGLLHEALLHKFPIVRPIVNPQWANVRGYLKYAIRMGKRDRDLR